MQLEMFPKPVRLISRVIPGIFVGDVVGMGSSAHVVGHLPMRSFVSLLSERGVNKIND